MQVHRSRIYGVLTGAGGALALAGTIGAISKGLAVVLLTGGGLSRAPEPISSLAVLTGLAVAPACSCIWEISSRSAREANAAFGLRHVVAVFLGLILWAGVVYSYVYPEPEVDPYADYGY